MLINLFGFCCKLKTCKLANSKLKIRSFFYINCGNNLYYNNIYFNRELHLDSIAKISWINVHIAFQMLNATPRYIFSHRWGYKRNGQWSGMINDINTGRADLGNVWKI